jgi:tricorn protease
MLGARLRIFHFEFPSSNQKKKRAMANSIAAFANSIAAFANSIAAFANSIAAFANSIAALAQAIAPQSTVQLLQGRTRGRKAMPLKHIFKHTLPGAAALIAACVACAAWPASDSSTQRSGYYRYPSVHGDTVVFTSEGDLWTVGIRGGTARRLTSNSGVESMARISPDGQLVAFVGQYEGPSEVYTVPLAGGIPERRTWNGDSVPAAWAPDGRLMVSTDRYSTLPDPQLVLLDKQGGREVVPLAEGSEAAYSSDGRTLFFTRWRKQPSSTKRYQGGYNETIWRFDGAGEAVPLTADWAGTSRNPMYWNERIYFLSDRDGVMNV